MNFFSIELMKKVSLIPYFSLAFFYHLSLPFFYSFFPVLYFAPFFSYCYSRCSLFFCLWASFFIGFFLDMCCTSTPLGFYPICCIGTTAALYRFRVYFLEDKPIPFALYTGLYSFTYTIIFTFLHRFIDTKFKLDAFPFLLDITFLPILDTFYHLLLFTLPVKFYLFLTAREQKRIFLRLKKRFYMTYTDLKKRVLT